MVVPGESADTLLKNMKTTSKNDQDWDVNSENSTETVVRAMEKL